MRLKIHAIQYVFIEGDLYWRSRDGVLLFSLDQGQEEQVLKDMHDRAWGGHYTTKTTTHKVLRFVQRRPTLFAYAHKMVKKYESYQIFSNKLKFIKSSPIQKNYS